MLREGDPVPQGAGKAKHVTVVISTVPAKCFHLHPHSRSEASELGSRTSTGLCALVGPGAQADLPLKSDQFAFNDDRVSATARPSAEGLEPWEGVLDHQRQPA
jgi:hypothetical protein